MKQIGSRSLLSWWLSKKKMIRRPQKVHIDLFLPKLRNNSYSILKFYLNTGKETNVYLLLTAENSSHNDVHTSYKKHQGEWHTGYKFSETVFVRMLDESKNASIDDSNKNLNKKLILKTIIFTFRKLSNTCPPIEIITRPISNLQV